MNIYDNNINNFHQLPRIHPIAPSSTICGENNPGAISRFSNVSSIGTCQYKTGKCTKQRAIKRNGEPHSLCEEHRNKQNIIQRKSDRKYQNEHAIRRKQRTLLKKKICIKDPTSPVSMNKKRSITNNSKEGTNKKPSLIAPQQTTYNNIDTFSYLNGFQPQQNNNAAATALLMAAMASVVANNQYPSELPTTNVDNDTTFYSPTKYSVPQRPTTALFDPLNFKNSMSENYHNTIEKLNIENTNVPESPTCITNLSEFNTKDSLFFEENTLNDYYNYENEANLLSIHYEEDMYNHLTDNTLIKDETNSHLNHFYDFSLNLSKERIDGLSEQIELSDICISPLKKDVSYSWTNDEVIILEKILF